MKSKIFDPDEAAVRVTNVSAAGRQRDQDRFRKERGWVVEKELVALLVLIEKHSQKKKKVLRLIYISIIGLSC